jgi:endonuclease/exonuclease/phosphatase (EEP) superfamily protein YafD
MDSPPSPALSKRPKFSARFFVRRRLRFIAVAMPVACAILLLPLEDYVFELLRQFRLWNAIIGLVTGALLLLLRDWKYAGVALLAGLWQGWPVLDYRLASSAKDMIPDPSRSFTVLTCNLLYECREPDRMIASLREADPDILILLEFTPRWEQKFAAELWKDYPHRVSEAQPAAFGICLASRLPLEDARLQTTVEDIYAARAIVTVAGQRITILGVHSPPPVRPEMYDPWRAAFDKWPELLLTAKTSHRVLAGDLNSTPFSRAFERLCNRNGLRDSARGYSLTNTWHLAGTFLGLPLDHILVSHHLLVTSRTLGPAAGSDHHWVMARITPDE